MNSPTENPGTPETELHLTQVDPPHPFKSAWKTVAAAAVLLTVAVAIFVFFVHRPPEAAGEILEANYYPVHSTESGSADAGMAGGTESFNQLVILANVRVRNQTNVPLFLQDISANVTLADGSIYSDVGAGSQDFNRVFTAFPSLVPLRRQPFDRNATVNPGETTEGLTIFSFPISRQQWDSRKIGQVRVSFLHQRSLVLSFHDEIGRMTCSVHASYG